MMKQKTKTFCMVLICAVCSILLALPVLAADYTIDDCWWDESGGKVIARWEQPESKTNYKVTLYRGSSKVTAGTATGTSYSFSGSIASKGTGDYTFRVYPIKGGTSYEIKSDVLEVDSAYLKEIKAFVSQNESKEKQPEGWVEAPIGWQYRKSSGAFAKNEWISVGGYRYYLGSDTIMKTGWQSIGGKWYYLNPDKNGPIPYGALYVSTVTPDGYTVDDRGVWEQGGVEVAAAKDLTSCSLSLQTGEAVNGLAPVTAVTSSSVVVESFSISPDPSSWHQGTVATIRVRVHPMDGSRFTGSTKFTCSGADSVKTEGMSETDRTVVLTYKPKYRLAQISGVYLTSDEELKWNRVEGANSYKLVFRGEFEDSSSKTITVSTNSYPLSGLEESLDNITSLTITATHSGTQRSSYTDSAAYTIKDFQTFRTENTVTGTLRKSTVNGKLVYRDDEGERFDGWAQISGHWYHFTNGYSDGPGWYKDEEDGHWYYFDSEFRMVTGTVTENGVSYFLNDGSRTDLPFGAWVEG